MTIEIQQIVSWKSGARPARRRDALAVEEPLEIRVRGRSIAVTMRTPGRDDELAAGFLLSEGLIRQRSDVVEIAHCRRGETANYQNTLNVFLSPAVDVNFEQLTRHVFASSSCGLCGKASIEAVHRHFPPVEPQAAVSARALLALPKRLRSAQKTFEQTGGLHAAGIFDEDGKLVVLREDVGRHNAVDKVVGNGFLRNHLPFDRQVLMVSGTDEHGTPILVEAERQGVTAKELADRYNRVIVEDPGHVLRGGDGDPPLVAGAAEQDDRAGAGHRPPR